MSKILYVEDNKDTAEAVKVILNAAGHTVELAHTGKSGLQKLKSGTYDLVILDVMLPDISGLEIFDQAKEHEKAKDYKYAFLSINPVSLEKLGELKKEGASDYISKPFKKDDLIKRIKKILDKPKGN